MTLNSWVETDDGSVNAVPDHTVKLRTIGEADEDCRIRSLKIKQISGIIITGGIVKNSRSQVAIYYRSYNSVLEIAA